MSSPDTSRTVTTRVIRLHEDHGTFDREQDAATTPQQRMEALWDLTLEYLAWTQPNVGEPRLSRSVFRFEHRRG